VEATELQSVAPRQWRRVLLLTSLGLLLTATASLPIVGSGPAATHVANRAGRHHALAPLDMPDDKVVDSAETTTTNAPHGTSTTATSPRVTPTTFPSLPDNESSGDDPVTSTDPAWPPVVSDPKVTQFDLPSADGYPQSIVKGPDGALWFTEASTPAIGRITPAGHVDEFKLHAPFSTPVHVVVGPDDALWFDDGNASHIGRITTSGDIHAYATGAGNGSAFALTSGPDGALWFTGLDADEQPYVARMTAAGVVTKFPSTVRPQYLTAGPGNYVWATYFEGSG
jgi:streptogramin lyase